jgi:hypothetical protein
VEDCVGAREESYEAALEQAHCISSFGCEYQADSVGVGSIVAGILGADVENEASEREENHGWTS